MVPGLTNDPSRTQVTPALRANLALIERVPAVLTAYPADKDADPRKTITRSLQILDGPQQREATILAAEAPERS
jgi:hypothetical protein